MLKRFRSARWAVLGAALVVTSIVGTAAGSASAATPTSGLSYVALGDSYAAGFGLAPLTGLPVPECGQASVDYPHQVATALGLVLTDVTCAGAITDNLVVAQGNAPAQATALSPQTQVVSVTIGGNDLGFGAISQTCIALSAAGPLAADQALPNCSAGYNGGQGDQLQQRLLGLVVPKLAAAFATITAAAPNAKVFVVGYPAIFPAVIPAAGCFSAVTTPNSFPFTDVDVAYLHGVETALNGAIQAAATTAEFTYVPAVGDSADHSACAAPASAFVNGVTLSGNLPLPFSLHPNAGGVASMTAQLSSAIEAAFPAVVTPPVVTPPVIAPADPATGTTNELAATGPDTDRGLLLASLLLSAGLAITVPTIVRRRRVRATR
ncbi:MAG: SGNH/GDSL hydrolase family protein [Burkholderiaceae bacterium]|nr:SGNH/GDSL hydrolase family protein [Microbacteriaceae bacterium]